MLSFPHCLDKQLIGGGNFVSSTHRPHYSSETLFLSMFLVLISARSWGNPRALCGRKDWVNFKFHLIGSLTRDLLACSLVSTTLQTWFFSFYVLFPTLSLTTPPYFSFYLFPFSSPFNKRFIWCSGQHWWLLRLSLAETSHNGFVASVLVWAGLSR
jgi:hypothetical protein